MSRGPENRTEGPSKTARKKARALVNEADRILTGVLDPTSWQPDSRAIAAFLESPDFERLLGLYLRAMDLDAGEPAYPWNLGSALNRLGRPDLALGLIGRAVKTGEEIGDDEWAGPDGYLLWAETAINAAQDDLAVVAIARAVAQAPDDEETAAAAVTLLRALANARASRGVPCADDLPVWVLVMPEPNVRSSGAGARTADLMAGLIERAFPAAAEGRMSPRGAPEPV